MNSMDTAHQKLVRDATVTLNQCFAQVQDELAHVVLNVLGNHPEALKTGAIDTFKGSRATFLETIDTVHQVIPFLPKVCAQELKPMIFGAEGIWALADGFLRKLTSSDKPSQVIHFELTDRWTHRSVPVVLPVESSIFLAAEISKTLRKLKKFRQKIPGS